MKQRIICHPAPDNNIISQNTQGGFKRRITDWLLTEGVDPVRANAMRDKYPFHPRFVIVDPRVDLKEGKP